MCSVDRTAPEDNGYCFACSQENPHGLKMQVAYQEDAALCSITLPQHFQGWETMAHGGIVSTLLDEIMAHAVIHFVGLAVTASMDVRYRSMAPLNQKLEVRGWVDHVRGRLVMTKAKVSLAQNGKVLAEAGGKFLLQENVQATGID